MLPVTAMKRLEALATISTQGKPINGLFRLLETPMLWNAAYATIYANAGALTAGVSPVTLDGFSEERVTAMITRLKTGTYRPLPTRRTYVPKANGKKRPLGISEGNDKLLQEVVRTILEKIYEPVFAESSHGFRPGRSPHTALEGINVILPPCRFFRRLADAKCDILKNKINFFEQNAFLNQFKSMTILPDLSDLVIEQVSITNGVTVTVHAASPTAPYPCCGTISKKIQSRYTRTLRDLPVSGHAARLIVQVRRFFCQENTCARKIFAERFPSLTLPRVTSTLRLQETLRQMGFALGGEAGARLGKLLSMPGSPDTLLRLIKRSELPIPSSPRVVGVDDWSWKRRLRYGTLICDLERGVPIDVLPDRSVETVSAWFENHPSVEIVSRDRSSEYAAAIRKGAPQALQIADRWHIAKNVAESVSTLLARCRADIRRALQAQETPKPEPVGTVSEPEEERRPVRSRNVEQTRLAHRAQKQDRYAQVIELHHQGVKPPAIASRIGIGERTVWRWLRNGSFPEARQRRRRPSLIDRYKRYVLARWQEGCHNGSQIYKELTAQGYDGSRRAMYSYLTLLRTPQATVSKSLPSKQREHKNAPASLALLENFSAQRATWLFVCQPDDLDEASREELALLRQANPNVEIAYHLTQTFMSMIRERTGDIFLEPWLQEANACHLPEFQSIARGIQKDKAAVLAGLTLAWSNGPTEGHVNRLKLIKRSMYGRAKLHLLRQRVLHVA